MTTSMSSAYHFLNDIHYLLSISTLKIRQISEDTFHHGFDC